MEIIITAIIVSFAVYILYKTIKKGASGKCPGCCGSSSGCASCSMRPDKASK